MKLKTLIAHNWKKIIPGTLGLLVIVFIVRKIILPPKTMETYVVSKGEIVSSTTSNGQVKAKKQVDLKFNLPGKLVWLNVKEGDQVQAYQAVASLDQRLLEKDLQNSLSLYMTNRMDFDTTQKDTYKDQLFTNVISRKLDQSQYSLDRSVLAVEISNIAKKEAVLITPFAGTVVDTHDLVTGVNLSATDINQKTIRVIDPTTIYFEADIDEIDFAKISLDQPAIVTFDSYPGQSCSGQVSYIGQEGTQTTGGVITVPANIDLIDCPLNLIPGFNGQANLVLNSAKETLVIPQKYLINQDGQDYVNLQTSKNFRQKQLTPVTTGIKSNTKVEILDGLSQNQTILYLP